MSTNLKKSISFNGDIYTIKHSIDRYYFANEDGGYDMVKKSVVTIKVTPIQQLRLGVSIPLNAIRSFSPIYDWFGDCTLANRGIDQLNLAIFNQIGKNWWEVYYKGISEN